MSEVEDEEVSGGSGSGKKEVPPPIEVEEPPEPLEEVDTTPPKSTKSTKGKYVCDECGKSFDSKRSLASHCGAMDHEYPDRYRKKDKETKKKAKKREPTPVEPEEVEIEGKHEISTEPLEIKFSPEEKKYIRDVVAETVVRSMEHKRDSLGRFGRNQDDDLVDMQKIKLMRKWEKEDEMKGNSHNDKIFEILLKFIEKDEDRRIEGIKDSVGGVYNRLDRLEDKIDNSNQHSIVTEDRVVAALGSLERLGSKLLDVASRQQELYGNVYGGQEPPPKLESGSDIYDKVKQIAPDLLEEG